MPVTSLRSRSRTTAGTPEEREAMVTGRTRRGQYSTAGIIGISIGLGVVGLVALVGLVLGIVAVAQNSGTPGHAISDTPVSSSSISKKDLLQQYPLKKSDVQKRAEHGADDTERADHLILGCGTAGSLLFNELARAFPNEKVVCLDAGQDDTRLASANPPTDDNPQFARAGSLSFLGEHTLGWHLRTRAIEGGDTDKSPVISDAIGATWGGTSAINAAGWVRPSKDWFDEAEERVGSSDYSYAAMIDAIKSVERQGQSTQIFGQTVPHYDGSVPGRTLDPATMGVNGRVPVSVGYPGPDIAAMRDVLASETLPGRTGPLPTGLNQNDPLTQDEGEFIAQFTQYDQSDPNFDAINPYAGTAVGTTYTPFNDPGNAKGPAYAATPVALAGVTYKSLMQRGFAAPAFLYPIVDNSTAYPNAEIRSRAFVTKLLFRDEVDPCSGSDDDDDSIVGNSCAKKQREVIGVEYVEDGYHVFDAARSTDRSQPQYRGTLGFRDRSAFTRLASEANRKVAVKKRIFASRYVWSALGTKHSAKLLMQSGIGDQEVLRSTLHGPIETRVNLPGVGRGVQETTNVGFTTIRENDMGTGLPSPAPASANAVLYAGVTTFANPSNPFDPVGTSSIIGTNQGDIATVKFKSSPSAQRPDVTLIANTAPSAAALSSDYGTFFSTLLGLNTPFDMASPPTNDPYLEGVILSDPNTQKSSDLHTYNYGLECFSVENEGVVEVTNADPFVPASYKPGMLSLDAEMDKLVRVFRDSLLPLMRAHSKRRYGFRGLATYAGVATGGTAGSIDLFPFLALAKGFDPAQPGFINQATYDAPSALSFYSIVIVAGTGAGQSNVITVWSGAPSYSATTLLPWAVVPDATSTYVLNPPGALPTDAVKYTGDNSRNFVRVVAPDTSDFTSPYQEVALAADPLTTSAGSTRVRINAPGHLIEEGEFILLTGVNESDSIAPEHLNDYHIVDTVVDQNNIEIVLFWNPSPLGGPGSAPIPSPAAGAVGVAGVGGAEVVLSKLYFDASKLRPWIKDHYFSGWHASGSCRMGKRTDPLAVVDTGASVYNTKGLKVVDASILPSKPDANTMQIVYGYAKRVSELEIPHLAAIAP